MTYGGVADLEAESPVKKLKALPVDPYYAASVAGMKEYQCDALLRPIFEGKRFEVSISPSIIVGVRETLASSMLRCRP
jgi:hypothetical protein